MTRPLMELLERPQRLEEEAVRLRMDAAAALDRCRRITARWGAEPRSGFAGGRRDGMYADLCDLTARQETLSNQLEEARAELDAFLERVRAQCGFRDYCILRWHYRLYHPWTKVRLELQETFGFPVTLRTTQNWHRAALRRAAELLEQEKE